METQISFGGREEMKRKIELISFYFRVRLLIDSVLPFLYLNVGFVDQLSILTSREWSC
jgi:hypothetical protein